MPTRHNSPRPNRRSSTSINDNGRRRQRRQGPLRHGANVLHTIWWETHELWDLVLYGVGDLYYKIRT
ncbi:hypothetical protein P8C59_005708 [Phyllachora maydis]|uniref:Uncharacterized protein n=1 Tax=Phyllachora maydis TaxID=1825666 RepID=A0AAD9I4Y3_9PEZI|nr:hypothetical protein P8C59_005708 [Phyllachora maydis]